MPVAPARSRHLLRTAVLLLSLLSLSGCASKPTVADAGAPAAAALAPVPAPADLLADVFLSTPDATWVKARTAAGNPVFIPQSFAMIAAAALRIPTPLAGEIDGNVPALGVVLKRESDAPRYVLGIHVRSGDRLVAGLTTGPDAHFSSTVDELTHIAWVARNDATPSDRAMALGVLGNYLLVGQSQADVLAGGPYVARTLPTRLPPKEDLVFEIAESALATTIADNGRRQWTAFSSQAENSLGVSLQPVSAIVGSLLDVFGDAKRGRLTVELDATAIRARLTLTPKPGGGPASKVIAAMTVGDMKPLLDLPAGVTAGILWRDAAQSRLAGVDAQSAALSQLLFAGARASTGAGAGASPIPESDTAALAAAMKAESAARGDWVALGVTLGPTGATASARAPVADEDQMKTALQQLVALAKLPSVRARLAAAQISVTAGKTVVENLPGDVGRVRFDTAGPDAQKAKSSTTAKAAKAEGSPTAQGPATPRSVDVLYLLSKGMLFGAAGQDAGEVLRATVKGEPSLGSSAEISRALALLGGDVSAAAVVDIARLIAARSGGSAPSGAAPVVLALGRTAGDGELWVRLDLTPRAVQEMYKARGGM